MADFVGVFGNYKKVTFGNDSSVISNGTYFMCYPFCGESKRVVVEEPINRDLLLKYWRNKCSCSSCDEPALVDKSVQCDELVSLTRQAQVDPLNSPASLQKQIPAIYNKYRMSDMIKAGQITQLAPSISPGAASVLAPVMETAKGINWTKVALYGFGAVAVVGGLAYVFLKGGK